MSGLTQSDRKFWPPVPEVTQWLQQEIPENARVLEVGPGHVPFPRADFFVDLRVLPNLPAEKTATIDLTHDKLPFPDKSFDFIYCRHVLEDMYDPFPLCAEMSRVGKAGYIETPSPVAELCQGIDGGSPPWRGYHHHRFIVWEVGNTLCFVSKFSVIEHIKGLDTAPMLRLGPLYWNTYHLWKDRIETRHLQCPKDFDIVTDYPAVLDAAARASREASDRFSQKIQPKPARVSNG